MPLTFAGRPHPSCEQSKYMRHGNLVGQAYGPITSTRYGGVEFARGESNLTRGDSNLKEFQRT